MERIICVFAILVFVVLSIRVWSICNAMDKQLAELELLTVDTRQLNERQLAMIVAAEKQYKL